MTNLRLQDDYFKKNAQRLCLGFVLTHIFLIKFTEEEKTSVVLFQDLITLGKVLLFNTKIIVLNDFN